MTIPHGEKPKGPFAAGTDAMAPWILVANVTNVPSTNKKPAIEALWTYFPIVGRSLKSSIAAMISIIITEDLIGFGAVAVPEIIASTGPPPKKEDPMSARDE